MGTEVDRLKRAFLIDDDAVFRLGLSKVLADEFAIETVGSRGFGCDCRAPINAARADLLLLTLGHVEAGPVAWLRDLLSPPRELTTIMLLAPRPPAGVRELVALGAAGYLSKPFGVADLSRLIGAIRRQNGGLVDPAHAHFVSDVLRGTLPPSPLSEREVLVVRRTADGRTSAQIAEEFGVSVKTAERYRRTIFSKLKLQSVAELTKFALREGYTAL